MGRQPLISVVVPVYNVKDYLEECVNSVLGQSFEDFEAVLVDDGSTDGSDQVCEELVRRDSRVSLIRQENAGLSEARNTGVGRARGEFILLLDSDDLLLGDTLADIARACSRGPDVVAISGVKVTSTGRIPLRERGREVKPRAEQGKSFLLSELLQESPNMMAPLYLYRRRFLVANGFRFKAGILHEDEEWTPRVLIAADSVLACEAEAYGYRVRPGSITQRSNRERRARDIFLIVRSLRREYESSGDSRLTAAGLEYLARLQMFAMSLASRGDLRRLKRADLSWMYPAVSTPIRRLRAALAVCAPASYGRLAATAILSRSTRSTSGVREGNN